MKLTRTITIEAKYLRLAVSRERPTIPDHTPGISGGLWLVNIDLDERRIVGWTTGKKVKIEDLDIRYAESALFDAKKVLIAELLSVPPAILFPFSSRGYGYTTLDIDEDGTILNWKDDATLKDFSYA